MAEELLITPATVSFTRQGCMKRFLRLGPRATEPLLELTIGGDDGSQGLTLWATEPSGGQHPHVRCLQGTRWLHRYTTVEDMLTIAIRALQKELDSRTGK